MLVNDNQQTKPQRYIEINGKPIPVNEDVYRAFKRPAWAEHKYIEREKRCRDEKGNRCTKSCRACDLERAEKGLEPIERTGSALSLDKYTEEGFVVADSIDLAELVADKLLLGELYAALAELDADERSLINALFYNERTEREYADEIKISHQGLNKRKKKVIEKLRGLIKANN